MSQALFAWANWECPVEEKTEALRRFALDVQSNATGRDLPEVEAPPTATPQQVEDSLRRLQSHGLLPSTERPWLLRLLLRRIEPERALQIMSLHKQKQLNALRTGSSFDAKSAKSSIKVLKTCGW